MAKTDFPCAELTDRQVNRIFFGDYHQNSQGADGAREICARCKQRPACLEWALEHPDLAPYGVFGGTTPQERQKLAQGRLTLAQIDQAWEHRRRKNAPRKTA